MNEESETNQTIPTGPDLNLESENQLEDTSQDAQGGVLENDPSNPIPQSTHVFDGSVTIASEEFNGPIELLLKLIEDRKLAINDISLAEITDAYIDHVSKLTGVDFDQTTHFITVAATLILIKSKSLLPTIDLTVEEEQSIEELQYRLRLFKVFQDRALDLDGIFFDKPLYTRPFRLKRVVAFSPDAKNMNKQTFSEVCLGILRIVPTKEKLPEVRVRLKVHIEELMNNLQTRLKNAFEKPVSFKSFSKSHGLQDATEKETKVYTIVSFLAMLELARNGLIALAQQSTFQDIGISKKGKQAPSQVEHNPTPA